MSGMDYSLYYWEDRKPYTQPSEWNFCTVPRHITSIDPETGENIKLCCPLMTRLTWCHRMTLNLEKKRKILEVCHTAMTLGIQNPLKYIKMKTNVPPRMAHYIIKEAQLHKDMYREKSTDEEEETEQTDS